MVYCKHNLSASSIVLEEVVLQEVKVFLSITIFLAVLLHLIEKLV